MANNINQADNLFKTESTNFKLDLNDQFDVINKSTDQKIDIIKKFFNTCIGYCEHIEQAEISELFYLDKDLNLQKHALYNSRIAGWARKESHYFSFTTKLVNSFAALEINDVNRDIQKAICSLKRTKIGMYRSLKILKDIFDKSDKELYKINEIHEIATKLISKQNEIENFILKQSNLIEPRETRWCKDYNNEYEELKNIASKTIEYIKQTREKSLQKTKELFENSDISNNKSNNNNINDNIPINIPPPPPGNMPPPPPPFNQAKAVPLTEEEKKEAYYKKEQKSLEMKQKNRLSPDQFYMYTPPSQDISSLLQKNLNLMKTLYKQAPSADLEKSIRDTEEKLKGEKTVSNYSSKDFQDKIRKMTTKELELLIKLATSVDFSEDELKDYPQIITILEKNKGRWVELFRFQGGIPSAFKKILNDRNNGSEIEPKYEVTPYEQRKIVKEAKFISANNHAKEHMDALKAALKCRKQYSIDESKYGDCENDQINNFEFKLKKTSNNNNNNVEQEAHTFFKLRKVKLTDEEKNLKKQNAKEAIISTIMDNEKSLANQELIKLKGNNIYSVSSVDNFYQNVDALKIVLNTALADLKQNKNSSEEELHKAEYQLEQLQKIVERYEFANDCFLNRDPEQLKIFEEKFKEEIEARLKKQGF